jgi:hypothetical protein
MNSNPKSMDLKSYIATSILSAPSAKNKAVENVLIMQGGRVAWCLRMWGL